MGDSKRKNADSFESAFLANLADYDTRDDAPCTVQQRVHLHPGAYRAITGSPLV